MSDILLPIQIQNLTLKSNKKNLLDGINCTINQKGVSVIMGPNGAGKSLLVRCIHGLITSYSGVILFNGKPLNSDMRKRQSFVFQQPILLRRSVLENVLFAIRSHGSMEASAQRELANMWLYKLGLTPFSKQPARLLSGGEKQRLALARALATKPDILFLDEATSNLDPASVQMIETITLQAAKNNTKIIAITHDIAQARRLADEMLFIAHGRILEQRSAKDFFAKPQSNEAKAYLEGKLIV